MSASIKHSFLDKLIYLGGNLGIQAPLAQYIDLEEFIAEGTYRLEKDIRIKNSFYNWIYCFAPYFSPSKLRRIIKNLESPYSKETLAEIIAVIQSHPLNDQNWKILLPYGKKSINFKFTPNPKKYLKTNEYILRHCPEIRFRVEGSSPVLADLKAYLAKNKKYKSLYEIAKYTFNPRNRINHEFKLMNYLYQVS